MTAYTGVIGTTCIKVGSVVGSADFSLPHLGKEKPVVYTWQMGYKTSHDSCPFLSLHPSESHEGAGEKEDAERGVGKVMSAHRGGRCHQEQFALAVSLPAPQLCGSAQQAPS